MNWADLAVAQAVAPDLARLHVVGAAADDVGALDPQGLQEALHGLLAHASAAVDEAGGQQGGEEARGDPGGGDVERTSAALGLPCRLPDEEFVSACPTGPGSRYLPTESSVELFEVEHRGSRTDPAPRNSKRSRARHFDEIPPSNRLSAPLKKWSKVGPMPERARPWA